MLKPVILLWISFVIAIHLARLNSGGDEFKVIFMTIILESRRA